MSVAPGTGDPPRAGGVAAVEVEDAAISIGGLEVVSSVSLDVGRGECLGLVGESGSGKTMTCRALVGLLGRLGGEVTRGSIRINGEDVTAAKEARWRQLRGSTISLVPQSALAALNPVRRVGVHLTEAIRLAGDSEGSPRETALALLEQVELSDAERVFRSYPHQLSGGMRQRVMIALAIASRPSVLIADEPTTALDNTVGRAIVNLLNSLREELGMTIVLVTHDLAVVRAMADRISVMYGGVSFESGTRAEALDHPLHPYTAALIGAEPALVPRGEPLVGLPGSPPDPRSWESGCRFAPRCPTAEAEKGCFDVSPPLDRTGERRVACHRWRELAS